MQRDKYKYLPNWLYFTQFQVGPLKGEKKFLGKYEKLDKILFCTFFFILKNQFFPTRRIFFISGGFNHLQYLLSISVSMAVIKDFSKYYMKAV